jgi:integrase
LEAVGKDPRQVSTEEIRSYLSKFHDKSASTRANLLKSLKRFYCDFLKMPQVVESFKFPKRVYAPRLVPSKEDLQRFFDALDSDRDRAIFLMYATSGLRKSELLGLSLDDIDLENRLIIPKNAHTTGTTKNTWATCFNVEAQTYLRQYLASRKTDDKRLFSISETTLRRIFRGTRKRTGLDIRPQVLREWFCCQLGELGVPDRYVDALCGRVPKSVLARHYTDYSPNRLKTIYDKANLRVLT